MKKTLITLLALSGLAMSAELQYSGTSGGWFEVNTNWTDLTTQQTATSKPQNNDTVYIGGLTTVKLGNNGGAHTYTGMTINIGKGSTLTLDYNTGNPQHNFSGCTLNVDGTLSSQYKTFVQGSSVVNIGEFGKVSLTGSDCKIGGGTTWNIKSAEGLTLGESWLDDNGAQGKQTFNLYENGSVVYNTTVKLGTYFSGYQLTATCTDGYIDGSGALETYTRELVKFEDGITLNGGTIAKLNDALSGTFNLNGTTLTAGDLTSAGQYQLAYDETAKAIVLSYSAYATATPEPATATLSLLALAGLAARRRRK